MTYPLGVRSVGLAMLAVAVVGCASPYTYYGDSGRGPCSLSGRYAGCEGAPAGDCAGGDCAGGDCAGGDCAGGDCAGGDCGVACAASAPCRLRDLLACNGGCGRIYWGEWAYDPPDECDACNDHGDWVGPRPCPPRGWLNLFSGLCGARHDTPCGSPTCTNCTEPAEVGGGTEVFTGDAPEDVWLDESDESFETIEPSTSPDRLPPDSVLRESRKPTPTRHPASRLVRRGRTSEVH